MKYRFIAFALSALFVISCSSLKEEEEKEQGVFPYEIHQTRLDNGLNVVTVPYNSPGLAAFYIVVRAGSRNEIEPGKTGFAHFFEHMMFRGTEKYSKEKYSEELKAIGAAANANTWWDRTVYHMTGNANMLDKMFELESDRFMNLKYSEADFKVEAGAVKGEYTKNYASPYMKLYEKTYNTAFKTHTYSHTTMGFWEDVVDMPNQYEYSLKFFDRFYKPEYCTIIVVGDVTPEKVDALATEYFGKWKHGSYTQEIPVEPEQTETRYAHVQEKNFPPVLSLNYKDPAFSADNKDLAALDLIASIGFSEKSPLYKKLVVDQRKVRSLDAGGLDMVDPGLWSVNAVLVNPNDMTEVKNEIEEELNKFKTQPVDSAELAQAKSHIMYQYAMGIDSPDAIANSLAWFTWLTGNPADVNRAYARYETITPQDIMDAANRYLVSQHLTVATISADEEYVEPETDKTKM